MEMDIAICQNLIAQSDVFSMTADRWHLKRKKNIKNYFIC